MARRRRSRYDIAVVADQGMRRAMNQDRVVHLQLGASPCWAEGIAVADGMGGAAAGERASRLAVETLGDRLRDWQVQPERLGARFTDAIRPYLVGLVDGIHGRIVEAARADKTLEGMGSTLTFVAVTDGLYFGMHVGDSRAYLIRQGQVRQLTTDHAQGGGLAQALGVGDIEPEFFSGRVAPGDTLLLCSDGLTKHVDDTEFAAIVGSGRPARRAVADLVQTANSRGGVDNIAVGILAAEAAPRVRRTVWERQPAGLLAGLGLGAIGLLAASATAYFAYSRSNTAWSRDGTALIEAVPPPATLEQRTRPPSTTVLPRSDEMSTQPSKPASRDASRRPTQDLAPVPVPAEEGSVPNQHTQSAESTARPSDTLSAHRPQNATVRSALPTSVVAPADSIVPPSLPASLRSLSPSQRVRCAEHREKLKRDSFRLTGLVGNGFREARERSELATNIKRLQILLEKDGCP